MNLLTMPGFVSGPDYLRLPRDPQPWVVRHLVPVGGLTNLYGPPKSMKSYAALTMALAVANRWPWLWGFEVAKHGNVAYLQIDTPRGEWTERIERYEASGDPRLDISRIFFADMHTTPYPYNVLSDEHHQWLSNTLAAVKPVFVIVDTLRESFNGNENDSDVMKQVIGRLVAASRPAAMLLLSHSRKDNLLSSKAGNEDLMGDSRGSGYVAGRMDTVMKMTGRSMTLQGRSIGKTNFPVEINPETEVIELGAMGEEGASGFLVEDAIRRMMKLQPGRSQRDIARELEAMFKMTETTARRRVNAVAEKLAGPRQSQTAQQVNQPEPAAS